MKINKLTLLEIIMAGSIILVFSVMSAAGITRGLEYRTSDILLNLAPPIEEDKHIVIIDITDESIFMVGTFPWSRDTYTRGMILMKELGASYLTFDIEFIDRSPSGVNTRALQNDIPAVIRTEVGNIIGDASALVEAVARGNLRPSAAMEYLGELNDNSQKSQEKIVNKVSSLVRDNDQFLGMGMHLFGNAFATMNVKVAPLDNEATRLAIDNAMNKHALMQVSDPSNKIPLRNFFTPVLLGLQGQTKGIGFTNVEPDIDGVSRRVPLVVKIGDKYFAQLIIRPLLDRMGNPPLLYTGAALVIERSKLNPADQDMVIPLDSDGNMIINWSRKESSEAFHHLPYAQLVKLENLEQDIVAQVRELEKYELTNYADDKSFPAWYALAIEQLDRSLETGDQEAFTEYVNIKQAFIEAAYSFAKGPVKSQLITQIDSVLDGASASQKETLETSKLNILAWFSNLENLCKEYYGYYEPTKALLADAFCIIGNSATSTSDVGVTPFQSEYMNVGTHANIANTILQQKFLRQLPPWVGLLLALVFSAMVILVAHRLPPLRAALASFAILIVFVIVASVFYLVSGTFPGIAVPALTILAASIGLTLLKFRTAEKEKGFIRNAFARYLSDDVIKEILVDPAALNLGGDKKHMTAIFTDVRGFSTISEKLDPSDLVKLLNEYLTVMSDIVLDLGGYIDKYEGDAIIAFWGAPIPHKDHARRACLAAMRMKVAEETLNIRCQESGLAPSPLLTRIGINSGDMVVGNMGTTQRLNYTIMGNAVNLAARLEGVNKQYGTWTLISETTKIEAGDDFLFRSLDQVRVVGINTPVRLYEVVAEMSAATPAQKEVVAHFEEGIRLFESREWAKGIRKFEEALKIIPDDGPSLTFLERCQKNQKTPPAASWDGVFNLNTK